MEKRLCYFVTQPLLYLHKDDFPGAPDQEEGHNGVYDGVKPLVEREQHRAKRSPDEVSGGGTARHDDRKGKDGGDMEAMGEDVAGICCNSEAHDFDVEELQKKSVDVRQGFCFAAAGISDLADQGFIGEVEDVGRADVFGVGNDLGD